MLTCTHDHRAHMVDADRHDPTGTGKIVQAWTGEVNRRFARLSRLIREAVVERNVFAIGGVSDAQRFDAMQFMADDVGPPAAKAFSFKRTDSKVKAFMRWLEEAQSDLLLGVEKGTPVKKAANTAWSNTYIRRAYKKGVGDAGARLRRGGATVANSWISGALDRPIHADRMGLIFTRTFSELEGVTQAMDAEISRVLAKGLADGEGPQAIARSLTDRVEKIGRTRARLIARTETIATHATATLNSYREAQIEGVVIESEFTTAGDDAVCPECEALEGRVYSMEEAEGVIPVHPNCRCAWLPVVKDPEEVVLR